MRRRDTYASDGRDGTRSAYSGRVQEPYSRDGCGGEAQWLREPTPDDSGRAPRESSAAARVKISAAYLVVRRTRAKLRGSKRGRGQLPT